MNDKDVKRRAKLKARRANADNQKAIRNAAKERAKRNRAEYMRAKSAAALAGAIDLYNASMIHDNPELVAAAREASEVVEKKQPETLDEMRDYVRNLADAMGVPRRMMVDVDSGDEYDVKNLTLEGDQYVATLRSQPPEDTFEQDVKCLRGEIEKGVARSLGLPEDTVFENIQPPESK